MVKNIIFDFGGVLIDWNPEYLFSKIFDEKKEMQFFLNNICNETWNLKQDAGRSLMEGTAELQKLHPEYHYAIQKYYEEWPSMLGGTISENVSLIKTLKKRYQVYGLTNWSAETFPIAYKRFSFLKDLDGIVVSGKEKLIKPDERIYRLLLERYNLITNECLFIDDNFKNIAAANKLGFQTLHFTKSVNLKAALEHLNIL